MGKTTLTLANYVTGPTYDPLDVERMRDPVVEDLMTRIKIAGSNNFISICF